MTDGDAIWIICRDFHSEGLGEPVVAFWDEDEARAAVAIMEKAALTSLKLFRVPLWPDVVQQETREITP